MSAKQVIVVRRDLNMPVGKIASQVAHASLAAVFSDSIMDGRFKRIPYTEAVKEWFEDSFTKVVLGVDSEEELLSIYDGAESAKLIRSIIKDNGTTVFNGVPTFTAVGIGPSPVENIDKITGKLKLL